MNGLKSIQKRTRLRLVALGLMLGTVVVSLVGVLVGLVSLGTVVGSLVGGLGGLAIAQMMTWAIPWAVNRDIARLAALEKKEKNEPRLILPPGTGLRDMLHVIYPPQTAERVFDQIIADMQQDWTEAMAENRQKFAWWIRIRCVLEIFLTAVVHIVAILGGIFKLVK